MTAMQALPGELGKLAHNLSTGAALAGPVHPRHLPIVSKKIFSETKGRMATQKSSWWMAFPLRERASAFARGLLDVVGGHSSNLRPSFLPRVARMRREHLLLVIH